MLITIARGSYALGAILTGIYSIRPGVEEALGLSEGSLKFLLYFLITLFGLGIICHIIHYGKKTVTSVLQKLSVPNIDLRTRKATLTDLKAIDEMSSEAFGAAASNLPNIKTLHKFSDEIFWTIYDEKTDEIVGYFCFFRLTAQGVKEIKDGTFHGPCPGKKSITNHKRSSCPIYVGALYGKSLKAKAFVLSGLQSILAQVNAGSVYAKAATTDGVRILKKFNFLTLPSQPEEVNSYFVRHY